MTKHSPTSGFTIVELMISTVVFSVVMLVLASGVIFIGRQYYKGINVSKTREVSSLIVDEIAQGIQFSGNGTLVPLGPTADGVRYFCASNILYTYVIGRQVKTGVHGFVSRPFDCSSSPYDLSMSVGGEAREYLGDGMRLADLSVTNTPGSDLYTVRARVVAGDDDVLNGSGFGQNCISGAGSQYCAFSEIQTTVQRRL